MVVIRGRLPQEITALLEKALEVAMHALKEEEHEEYAPSVIAAKAGIPPPRHLLTSSDDSAETCRRPHSSLKDVPPEEFIRNWRRSDPLKLAAIGGFS